MKKNLEYQDENVSKFWEIEVTGKTFVVISGNVGATGRTQARSFANEAACSQEAERLVSEKLSEGYTERVSATRKEDPAPVRRPVEVSRPVQRVAKPVEEPKVEKESFEIREEEEVLEEMPVESQPAKIVTSIIYPQIEAEKELEEETDDTSEEEVLTVNKIPVDLSDMDDVARVLNMLVNDMDYWSRIVDEYGGLYYGTKIDGRFKVYGDGTAAGSENVFWAEAVKYEELQTLVEAYVWIADSSQKFSEDVQMGMSAVYHLTVKEDSYMPLFIDYHKKLKPGGGNTQLEHIADLIDKSNSRLQLLAACCIYEIDNQSIDPNIQRWIKQYVGDDYSAKEALFHNMMKETAMSSPNDYRAEMFMDALSIMNIPYDEEVIRKIIENRINVDNLPSLDSLKIN